LDHHAQRRACVPLWCTALARCLAPSPVNAFQRSSLFRAHASRFYAAAAAMMPHAARHHTIYVLQLPQK
jgi:hypothetical protein